MTRLTKLAWAIFALVLTSALILIAVGVWCIWTDEAVSRNEAAWTDSGGRHVEEMVSEKVADGD